MKRYVRAFTLIEMLTVIAIIGILAGLLLPAIAAARRRAFVSKAQVTVSQLTTAFRAYYTEYGKWPASSQWPPVPAKATYGGLGDTEMYVTTNLFANPRNILFYDCPAKDLDTAGTYGIPPNVAYLDPWKKPYRVTFDTGYSNTIANPFGTSLNTISAGVIIWSCGPDGSCSDKLPNASGGGGTAAKVDPDNVTSW